MTVTVPPLVRASGVGILVLIATSGADIPDPAGGAGAERMTAAQQRLWPNAPPPEGTAAIPVMVHKDLPSDAKHLLVCTYAGGSPRRWEVLTRGCRDEADYCTVFAAAPLHDVMAFAEYDAGQPPVAVATNDVCTAPVHPMTGVLGQRRD